MHIDERREGRDGLDLKTGRYTPIEARSEENDGTQTISIVMRKR
jgi:hypothetical protein